MGVDKKTPVNERVLMTVVSVNRGEVVLTFKATPICSETVQMFWSERLKFVYFYKLLYGFRIIRHPPSLPHSRGRRRRATINMLVVLKAK
jgi:hypothetical protein